MGRAHPHSGEVLLPTRLPALILALGLTGCALLTRHDFFEPIPGQGREASYPEVRPITRSTFHLFGFLLPVIPYYSRPGPLMVQVGFPSDLSACPPVRIARGGRGLARDTLQATSISYRACHYEWEGQAPDFLELDWDGRTLRTGFHRDVDWSYIPFFFPSR